MNKFNRALCIGGLMAAASAFAQTKTSPAAAGSKKPVIDQVSGQGYGAAGCGLGSVIFGQKPGIIQIFAVTTNGFMANQTFAISTGSLNCEDGGGSASHFIETNKLVLANDIARGQGETLASLSAIYGCQDSASFGKTLQQAYPTVFPSDNVSAEQVEKSIVDTIKANTVLATSCSKLG
jgi:hypothetical protein